MYNLFHSSVIENTSTSGDSITTPLGQNSLGKDFIVQSQPEKGFNFERIGALPKGLAKSTTGPTINEVGVERFNQKTFVTSSPRPRVPSTRRIKG